MFLKKLILAAGLAVALTTPAMSQVIGGEVDMNVDRDGDLRILAGEINVEGRIGGELSVIGGDITIDATVGRNVKLAGGSVQIEGSVGGDLDAAGGNVEVLASVLGNADLAAGFVHIDSPVAGSLQAAGGLIELESNFSAGDGIEVAAEQIILRGNVRGLADLMGDEITIEGRVDGDVETYARYVRVTPTAVITGRLIHRGPTEPDLGVGATVEGGVEFREETYIDDFDWDGIDLDLDLVPAGPFVGAFFVGFYFLLFLIAASLMPKGTSRVIGEFRRRPVIAPLIGFVTWAFWPIILVVGIFLLILTIVGVLLIPFWILAIVLILSLSYPFGAAAIGDLIFNRKGNGLGFGMRLLTTLGVLILASALWVVPVLGVVGWFVLTWIGLGSWLFALGKREDVVTQPTA